MATIYFTQVEQAIHPVENLPDTEDWTEEHRDAIIRHLSAFGQRGQTPDHRVQPHEWRHSRLVQPVTTPWHVPLSPDQLPMLLLGFVPVHNRSWNGEDAFRPGERLTTHIFMSSSSVEGQEASNDKWFVYADGPDGTGEVRLHMHSSWTGDELIELCINAGFEGDGRSGAGATITSITWESSPDTAWKDASAKMYVAVARRVCSWVLGVELQAGIGGDGENLEAQPGDAPRWIPPTVPTLTAAMKDMPKVAGKVYQVL